MVESCYEQFLSWIGSNKIGMGIEGGGIYNKGLVSWLMIYQRLQEGSSMMRVVDEIGEGAFSELFGDCKRVREGQISGNTGGYSLARGNLTVQTAERVSDDLFEYLRSGKEKKEQRSIFSIDGTTIELLRSAELARKYPVPANGHYPLMRMLVCHDLINGLAVRPSYGAFYGKNLKSESQLCKDMLVRLPKDSIVVGDRNFGIFSVVNCAKNQGIDLVLRLTESRAKKILGKQPKDGIDTIVEWTPSEWDLTHNPELSKKLIVRGRVVCRNVQSYRGGKVTPLCIFTTLEQDSVERVIELYGLRWNIEIDIRTLKQTTNMKMLKVKSSDMASKELLMGICAYNLIRSVMQVAATKLGIAPRDLSFVGVRNLIDIYSPKLINASAEEVERILQKFFKAISYRKHPKRLKKRVEPRALVRRRFPKYPTLSSSRAKARAQMLRKN